MVRIVRYRALIALLFVSVFIIVPAYAQQAGSIRGMVYDSDFDAPLAAANIMIAETNEKITATDQGNYVFPQVAPGTYTLVFSKDGYTREVKANVLVQAGQMTEVDSYLGGEFAEMEEFVVQDIQIGGSSEQALLNLRMESPALMDSIGADIMKMAGAGDAASAIKLVSGATVQDGKYAVIRGLPDRYVSSKMNGVRLPTADADKRAVQLDQFPSTVIESVQVSKTFTPDQQGDASGGAVNVMLKNIPSETVLKVSVDSGINTNSFDTNDFLTYKGGGVNFTGIDDRSYTQGQRSAAGVETTSAPVDYKINIAGGGRHDLGNGVEIGAYASIYYKRDSSHVEDAVEDSLWALQGETTLSPQYSQGAPDNGDPESGSFHTSLYDKQKSSVEVQWGSLGIIGLESENNALSFLYMYTHAAEDTAIIAEDTRGKAYYFDNYDVNDPESNGNLSRDSAPYLRSQALEYTERTTYTLQLNGRHTLPVEDFGSEEFFLFKAPELNWTLSHSFAGMEQPDKRMFGSKWKADSYDAVLDFWTGNGDIPAEYFPLKPAANATMGNYQRIWKEITESSNQLSVDFKLPFEQWTSSEGYFKFGGFYDKVDRQYQQDSYSNFDDEGASYQGSFDDYWSDVFPYETHTVSAADIDVDYEGKQEISAAYYMVDFPICSFFNIIGGMRYEATRLETEITPDPGGAVFWVPLTGRFKGTQQILDGDIGNVSYSQYDLLPAIGFVFQPIEELTFRGSYSQTVARQTFKELTPIQQQEYLGGDVFIGNPDLKMSSLKNYDLRFDYTPYEGGLISLSWFQKEITDPIEYISAGADYPYTTAINYPDGILSGYEIEIRQDMGFFWDALDGLKIGGNATFIKSQVNLPDDQAAIFDAPNINRPMNKRDMTNAPKRLFNFYFTYDIEKIGTKLGVFYTITGDTLLTGAGQSVGKFVPSVYAAEYGTLNMSISKKFGEHITLELSGKNLTNSKIETVYRSKYIDGDTTKTSYKKGIDIGLKLSAEF